MYTCLRHSPGRCIFFHWYLFNTHGEETPSKSALLSIRVEKCLLLLEMPLFYGKICQII